MQNYHAASGTYDKVNMRQLRLNLAQPLGVRQSRIEAEGLWVEWAAGTRGRFP